MNKSVPLYVMIAILTSFSIYEAVKVSKLEKNLLKAQNDIQEFSKKEKSIRGLKSEVYDLRTTVDELQSSSDDLDSRITDVEDYLSHPKYNVTTEIHY